MCDEYARSISQRVVAQLAEAAGFESAQESSIEILGDLLIRYMSELASGSHAYAEMASRSDVNAHDVFLSLDDLGSDAQQLQTYLSSLSVSPGS